MGHTSMTMHAKDDDVTNMAIVPLILKLFLWVSQYVSVRCDGN